MTCWEKMQSCFKLSSKLLDNNALQYEEAIAYFPQEYNWKFKLSPISQEILQKNNMIKGDSVLVESAVVEKSEEESKVHEVEAYLDSPRLADTNRFVLAPENYQNNVQAHIGTFALNNSLRNTTALFDYANTPMVSLTYRDQTRHTKHLKDSMNF
jgi:hypothetical protein